MKATAHFRIIFHMKIICFSFRLFSLNILSSVILFALLRGTSKRNNFHSQNWKRWPCFFPGTLPAMKLHGSDTPRAPSKSREAILQLAARRQRRPLTSSLGSWERLQCRRLFSTKMCCTWSLEDSPEGATVFISLAEDSPRERVVPFKLRAELRLLEVIDGIWTCGVYGFCRTNEDNLIFVSYFVFFKCLSFSSCVWRGVLTLGCVTNFESFSWWSSLVELIKYSSRAEYFWNTLVNPPPILPSSSPPILGP